MNKFKYYFILIIASVFLFSCSKDDNSIEQVPLRDYGEQFKADNDSIEKYLNTHYIEEIVNAPGEIRDQDVKLTKIPEGGTQVSIMSLLNRPIFPKLLKKTVSLHDITYEVYYLVLREGIGQRPTNTDGVFAAYKGMLFDGTVFDQSTNPQGLYNLDGITQSPGIPVIRGWAEVFPEFRTGKYDESGLGDGTLVYTDFGAGVMFLPSGLAYYSGSGAIPAYTPILFNIKLYELKRFDHDNDGIPDYLEDIDGDNYLRVTDDTDGDGIPDYLDIDDDGDGFTTRSEITINGVLTPFESIPDCSGNTTDTNRKRKHLDKNCH
ncbi:FKBP-type peptidyl-prolyl cis-trans isomerase [Flavobacterium seoulense]|uniref:peptidylprolyl isomerase n=1 Tax=Flavobacterium seoulense TaxID=1492738 RepID=A0A066WUI7_9FLAO|nr:hypothetical protein [Flavobacterium seoulense]KDN56238.1 hypothetical protein FEM21_07900 [Flavobacterium seoulense]